jgi:hypothetical protein
MGQDLRRVMEKLTLSSFLVSINACEVPCSVNANNHKYTPMEDAVAFYFSRFDQKSADMMDMALMKLNQKHGQEIMLGKSSFARRISNMDSTLTGGASGLKNNSNQGKIVAQMIDKMMRRQQLDRFHLRDLLNEFLGTKVL